MPHSNCRLLLTLEVLPLFNPLIISPQNPPLNEFSFPFAHFTSRRQLFCFVLLVLLSLDFKWECVSFICDKSKCEGDSSSVRADFGRYADTQLIMCNHHMEDEMEDPQSTCAREYPES